MTDSPRSIRPSDWPHQRGASAPVIGVVLLCALIGVGLAYFLFRSVGLDGAGPTPTASAARSESAESPTPPHVADPVAHRPAATERDSGSQREDAERTTRAQLPGFREIRGSVVRASDESGVWYATVIALTQKQRGGELKECGRVVADDGGNFVIRVPDDCETFRVIAPAPGATRDAPGKGAEVETQIEWSNGDPRSSEVRLVLATGWRLDLRFRDKDRKPVIGVAIRCGARSVTSDLDGRCTLNDLPPGDVEVEWTPHGKGREAMVRRVFRSPTDGSLRADAELEVP